MLGERDFNLSQPSNAKISTEVRLCNPTFGRAFRSSTDSNFISFNFESEEHKDIAHEEEGITADIFITNVCCNGLTKAILQDVGTMVLKSTLDSL